MTTKFFLRRQTPAAAQSHNKLTTILIALCVTAAVAIGLLSRAVPPSYSFAADAQTSFTGLANHSSFHYEFTRVLAAAAGFNTKDAETIAVACEATDTNSFEGYAITGGPITVSFKNTHRIKSPNRFFYHFGRRAQDYPIVVQPDGTAYPNALQNTCGYFSSASNSKTPQPSGEVTAPCKDPRLGELDLIRAWAIAGTSLPQGRAPVVAADNPIPHDSQGRVTGRNIYALGIYLHSLGDSYSHEKCMIQASFRYHKPDPYPCQTAWHLQSEFGDYVATSEVDGAGVPFTLTAAQALWQEILKYQKVMGGTPKWDDAQFTKFAEDFVHLVNANARVDFAVAEFNKLTGETVVPTPPSTSSSSRKQKKG